MVNTYEGRGRQYKIQCYHEDQISTQQAHIASTYHSNSPREICDVLSILLVGLSTTPIGSLFTVYPVISAILEKPGAARTLADPTSLMPLLYCCTSVAVFSRHNQNSRCVAIHIFCDATCEGASERAKS